MNIPDEAVEAAAKAMWDDSDPVRKKARPDWAAMKDDADWARAAIQNRRDARLALEAAAPRMLSHEREQTRLAHIDAMVNRETKREELAAAWDEGYRECYERQMYEPVPVNPYRKAPDA